MNLAVIDYPAGNIRSVLFALERLGVKGRLTSKPEEILEADRVIFPGVGEASTTKNSLVEAGLWDMIPKVQAPFLGICLGLQLMCEDTTEGDTEGLGIFEVGVRRFGALEKVPHMGWNSLVNPQGRLLEGVNEGEYVYFVHSYYAEDSGSASSTAFYGHEFTASLEKDNFFATQFHPEKSADVGERILKNFLELKC